MLRIIFQKCLMGFCLGFRTVVLTGKTNEIALEEVGVVDARKHTESGFDF